jgi:hypothetical protein
MMASMFDRLDQEFSTFPIMRASDTPSGEEVARAASALGVTFHDDYVAFLRRYGGAMVGSLPVFGLRPVKVMGKRWSVVDITEWFRNEGWPRTHAWYVISEDGFGNPIGVTEDGRVMLFDHDAGQEQVLARDFEHFLIEHCLKTP